MQLAWYSTGNEIVIGANVDAVRELAGDADATGVAWWIANGHVPTVDEAAGRLAFVEQHGVSPYAFPLTDPQPYMREALLQSVGRIR